MIPLPKSRNRRRMDADSMRRAAPLRKVNRTTGTRRARTSGRAMPALVLFLAALTASAAEFRVVSFNVNLHNKALEETIKRIAEQDADVVLIQESTDRFERAARRLLHDTHPHAWFAGEDLASGGGFAALSRFPVTDRKFIRRSTGAFGAQKFDVTVGGETVQFVNIHLNPAGRPRPHDRPAAIHAMMLNNKPQVLELRNILKQCRTNAPTVISGDLNSHSSQSAYKQLTSRGFIDAHLSVNAKAKGIPTWRMTLEGTRLQARFDYVFHNDRLKTTAFRVVENELSDHALLNCTLRLKD